MTEPTEAAKELLEQAREDRQAFLAGQVDGSSKTGVVVAMIQVQRAANQRFSTPPEE